MNMMARNPLDSIPIIDHNNFSVLDKAPELKEFVHPAVEYDDTQGEALFFKSGVVNNDQIILVKVKVRVTGETGYLVHPNMEGTQMGFFSKTIADAVTMMVQWGRPAALAIEQVLDDPPRPSSQPDVQFMEHAVPKLRVPSSKR